MNYRRTRRRHDPNPADYRVFEIYPHNKNFITDADEAIIRAANDRANVIILVPNRAMSSPEIEDVTRGARGDDSNPDFSIQPRANTVTIASSNRQIDGIL